MRILKCDGSQGSLILVCIRQTIKLLVQHSHALARPQSLAGALAVHQLPPHLEVPVAECVIAKNYQSTDPPVAGTRQHWIREMLNASRKFSGLVIFGEDRKSTRLNSSHQIISYAVF